MLLRPSVRVLEARFHPLETDDPAFVVIGHVVWDDGRKAGSPRVEPGPALARQTAPSTMLATLRHLVFMTSPKSFERLQALRSRFWSFVAVQAMPATGGDKPRR